MPHYRRIFIPGGTYFFTVVTYERQAFLTDVYARSCLKRAFTETRGTRPFDIVALCLLPDHLHTIWTLPDGDAAFLTRWAKIKGLFSRYYGEAITRGKFTRRRRAAPYAECIAAAPRTKARMAGAVLGSRDPGRD